MQHVRITCSKHLCIGITECFAHFHAHNFCQGDCSVSSNQPEVQINLLQSNEIRLYSTVYETATDYIILKKPYHVILAWGLQAPFLQPVLLSATWHGKLQRAHYTTCQSHLFLLFFCLFLFLFSCAVVSNSNKILKTSCLG